MSCWCQVSSDVVQWEWHSPLWHPFPKTQRDHEKTQSEGHCTWCLTGVPLAYAEVMKDKENCPRWEAQETRWLNVMWGPVSAPGLEIDTSGRTGQIQTQSAAQLMKSTAFVSNSSDASTVLMWNGNIWEPVSNVYWNSLHSFAIFYKFNIISKERVRIGICKSEIKLWKIFNLHFLKNAIKIPMECICIL